MPEVTTYFEAAARMSRSVFSGFEAAMSSSQIRTFFFSASASDGYSNLRGFSAAARSSEVSSTFLNASMSLILSVVTTGPGAPSSFHFLRRRSFSAKLLVDGQEHKMKSFSCYNKRNEGWSGSVTLKYSELNPSSILKFTEFRFYMEDEFNGTRTSYLTGKMARLAHRDSHSARKSSDVQFPLVDWSLKKLAKPGQSWPTFINQSSVASLSDIVAGTGVTLRNPPRFQVDLEEAKQKKALEAINLFRVAAGMDFVVGEDGSMSFFPATAIQGNFPRTACRSLDRNWDENAHATGLRIEKPRIVSEAIEFRFSTADFHTVQLPYGFLRCEFQDKSIDGWIDMISMWNGDPRKDGKLIELRSSGINAQNLISTVPFNGHPPITHLGVSVYKSVLGQLTGETVDAILGVSGIPYVIQQKKANPGFSRFFGSNEWPAEEVWVEPLIESEAYAQAHLPDYLWQRSRNFCIYSASWGHFVFGSIGQKLSLRLRGEDMPPAQVGSIGWEGSPEVVSSHVEANLITFT